MTGRARAARRPPAYLRPAVLLVVAAGGTLGTLIRALLGDAFPVRPGQWPWTTFCINVTGAFLLGLLLQTLALHGPDTGARRLTRLGLGTGVLGGYTTYSTFAVESAALGLGGRGGLALAYDGGSVLAGVLAAWLGFVVAVGLLRRGPAGAREPR